MAKLSMDDPFFLSKALRWYKRRDVQEAILVDCEQREVSPRFGQGFGKRPDSLSYPADVFALAQRRATSFHCSEERWRDPLQLVTGSSRKVLDELRVGWDLVLDIDCPYWFFAKLTAALFIRALRDLGVASVSAKFSGNKGFHVGVPFAAFPASIGGRRTSTLFPEAPRTIAQLLLNHISEKLITIQDNQLTFHADKQYRISFQKLQSVTGKKASDFLQHVCTRCGAPKEVRGVPGTLFLCTSCGHTERREEYHDYLSCPRCNGVMAPQARAKRACTACGNDEFAPRFNVLSLIEVDTILLASRHLFRTPYSLHEKSGLASIVIPPDHVMSFEKTEALPEKVTAFPRFLDDARVTPGEAGRLFQAAMEHQERVTPAREERTYAVPEEAIPEELFPPCIRAILAGLEDGKKRAMFALTNFLRTVGWGHDQIAARLEEWNTQNPEPLREVTVKSHVRYLKQKKEVYPPPNCKGFYQDIGVCRPDNLCARVKNPAQYAKRRAEAAGRDGKGGGRQRLTEEQKAMRKAWREKQKESAAKNI